MSEGVCAATAQLFEKPRGRNENHTCRNPLISKTKNHDVDYRTTTWAGGGRQADAISNHGRCTTLYNNKIPPKMLKGSTEDLLLAETTGRPSRNRRRNSGVASAGRLAGGDLLIAETKVMMPHRRRQEVNRISGEGVTTICRLRYVPTLSTV